jgi:hypothetical protein
MTSRTNSPSDQKKRRISESESPLTLVKFIEQPFTKANKAIGLYSITEDYFEQDVNSVFCKNSEFIETGETLGLLNLEKRLLVILSVCHELRRY